MAIAHKLVEFHLSPVKSRISWESIREEWSLKAITSDVQLSSLDLNLLLSLIYENVDFESPNRLFLTTKSDRLTYLKMYKLY